MTELETLRVSLARVAQTLGLHDHIPGCKTYWPAPYSVLALAAKTEQRGWNYLAALVVEEIERVQAKAEKYDDSVD